MSWRNRQGANDHDPRDSGVDCRDSQSTKEDHHEETGASGSSDYPRRAVHYCPSPTLPAYEGALSSNELPPKMTRAPEEGDDQMGPWIQLSPDACVYCCRNALHLTQGCEALPLEGIPVPLCYCVSKIYKKMHYMVGYDGCLHEACGCALDGPPWLSPSACYPSMVRVCRACFFIPSSEVAASDESPSMVVPGEV